MSALDPRESSGDKFDPSNSDITDVPEWFQRYLRAALASPLFSVPKPFETWMIDKVATSGFDLPVSQLVGFSQFTANFASAGNADTTSATSLGDLTNVGHEVGPTITGIPDGSYVLLYGALASVSVAGNVAAMNVAANGASLGSVPQGGDAEARGQDLYGISSGQIITLSSGGNNTLKAVYAVDDAGVVGTFGSRWMIALRYANA